MKPPEQYSHRILLCVTGLSPQVVTETVFFLAMRREPAFVPTEIHLITTSTGAEKAQLTLLSDEPGWFRRLSRDYSLPPIDFKADHIHVPRMANGRLLDDIRQPEDNLQAADFITAHVRKLTANPDCALHVSIAGGRKTMGFYLGYALSLYGRQQDRLSHVLVSEPFESSLNFFYPTPKSNVIQIGQTGVADTANAEVTLAEIPFVSLRQDLPLNLLSGESGFAETVAAAKAALAPPELVIDLGNHRIQAGRKVIGLPATQIALLSIFARRVRQGLPALPAPPKEVPDQDWGERFLVEYRQTRRLADDDDRTESAYQRGMDGGEFSILLSRLHKRLHKELGSAASPYIISDGNCRPRRYALTLPATAIHFSFIDPTPSC